MQFKKVTRTAIGMQIRGGTVQERQQRTLAGRAPSCPYRSWAPDGTSIREPYLGPGSGGTPAWCGRMPAWICGKARTRGRARCDATMDCCLRRPCWPCVEKIVKENSARRETRFARVAVAWEGWGCGSVVSRGLDRRCQGRGGSSGRRGSWRAGGWRTSQDELYR